jgi:predicted glycoside hydrolase/deacetylase ChbG (UPF0249 family)
VSTAQPLPRASELLGFAPDDRVLIVSCEDFGMSTSIDAAVVDAIDRGVASSCSLIVAGRSAPEAIELLARRPDVAFGIHLALVCEMPHTGWGPVAPRERVTSLLDGAGAMFAPTPLGRAALLGRARIEEVELEFRAQIAAVLDVGLAPTHLDFHCLADGGRGDILELTVDLAAEHGLAVRVWLEPGRAAMRRRGLPVVDNDFLDSFSLDLDGKAARYAQLLHDLPPGLGEWAVHPGLGDPQAQADDSGWLVRQSDHEFLTSSLAREILREEGISVIDYRAIQQVWRLTTACARADLSRGHDDDVRLSTSPASRARFRAGGRSP